MTRVGGANPRIWVDIFRENADELRAALAEHRRGSRRRALETRDAGFLARWIGEAAGNRPACWPRHIPTQASCSGSGCTFPTGRESCPRITQALGAEKINIEDFELQHLSPERGGTLTVSSRASRRRAVPPSFSRRRATP